MLHLLLFRMLQKSMPALAGIRVMLQKNVISAYVHKDACISRYSCNVTFCFAFCFTSLLPALAGIRVMLHF